MRMILKLKTMHKIRYEKYKLKIKVLDFYKRYGYDYQRPLPLKINFDPTLEYTNCTICIFKEILINDKPLKKYFTIQPALRTNTYKEIFSKRELIWNSELTMIGGFVPIETNSKTFNDVINEQLTFLTSVLNIKIFDFCLEIHTELLNKKLIDLNKVHMQENLKVNFEKNTDLEWNYGYNEIFGIGTRWLIINKFTKKRYNYGNVIAMFKNKDLIGFEFGGGMEVLIQAKISSKSKFFICDSFPNIFIKKISVTDNYKLIDSMITIFKIISSSIFTEMSELLKYTLSLYFFSIFEIEKKYKIDKKFFERYTDQYRNYSFVNVKKDFVKLYDYYNYFYQQNTKGMKKWMNKI